MWHMPDESTFNAKRKTARNKERKKATSLRPQAADWKVSYSRSKDRCNNYPNSKFVQRINIVRSTCNRKPGTAVKQQLFAQHHATFSCTNGCTNAWLTESRFDGSKQRHLSNKSTSWLSFRSWSSGIREADWLPRSSLRISIVGLMVESTVTFSLSVTLSTSVKRKFRLLSKCWSEQTKTPLWLIFSWGITDVVVPTLLFENIFLDEISDNMHDEAYGFQ